MASKVKENKINFKGKTVNIGIDMHKISWRITVRVEGDTALDTLLQRVNLLRLLTANSRLGKGCSFWVKL